MVRKPLIAILALLVAGGTAFARPRAVQPVPAVSAELKLSEKIKAARFRVSRPVMVRNPELIASARQQTSRTVVAA